MGVSAVRKTPYFLSPRKTHTERYSEFLPMAKPVVEADTEAEVKAVTGVETAAAAAVTIDPETDQSENLEVTPLADAFLCEPIPYISAVREGATHVIALRTRPDPSPVVVKGPGVYEKLIAKR